MASTRSRITPKDTFKPKIRRIPLAPKNIPATNISDRDGNSEADSKWITIAVAATADKENKDVGRITASAGRDLQWRKREDASPIGPASRRCSDDKWIIISLAEEKGSGKFVNNVDPGKVAFLPKNDMDASLAEELEMIRQKNERLRVERAKTDDIFKAKDQVMKRMEEQLELRWKAQERLEMEFERLQSLKELKDCLLDFQPVVPLREKHRSKPKTGYPLQEAFLRQRCQQFFQFSPEEFSSGIYFWNCLKRGSIKEAYLFNLPEKGEQVDQVSPLHQRSRHKLRELLLQLQLDSDLLFGTAVEEIQTLSAAQM